MKCTRCQQENPPQAKFCLKCGTALALKCRVCGTELPIGAKFCFECGQSLSAQLAIGSRFASPEAYTPKHLAEKILTSKSALEGERKQVTVLFADLKGSMELLADRDPEEARKLLDPVSEHMMEAVHRYEGTVSNLMGDGITGIFGAPLAHEDHAVRACYAALRMQESVKKYAEGVRRTEGIPIQIRVGLNSGEIVVRSIGSDLKMDYTAVGQTTHLAARMEHMATPGTIMMTPDTLRFAEGYVQVKPIGLVNVKGLREPVEVYEIMGAGPVRSRLQAAAVRGLTRFVRRDAETELEGIQGHQRRYITWLLEQCAAEVDPRDILTPEALDLLAERLITPLQIQHYLTRVLEQAYRLGEKPVTPALVMRTLAPDMRDLEPTSTRYGYNRKAEVRAFLHGQLPPGRTEELHNQLLASGIPLSDRLSAAENHLATG